MARAYISSTYSDLREHRESVYRALRRLGSTLSELQPAEQEKTLVRLAKEIAALVKEHS